MSVVKSKQISEEKVSFAAALLGLIYTSIRRFSLDFYGSRWEYLMWTSTVTGLVVLSGLASLLAILSPKLTLYLLAHKGAEVLIGLGIASVLMQILLSDNERLRRWTEQGKQNYKLLDRFGGQITLTIILFAVLLGPIVAIFRIAGVSV